MRFFAGIVVTMFLIVRLASAQDKNDTLVNYQLEDGKRSIQFFNFCGVEYKIPRECDKRRRLNCCAAEEYSYGGNLGCNNGVNLIWTYYPTATSLRGNFENRTNNGQKDHMKTFNKVPITCYLLGEQVEAYKISFESLNGLKWESVYTYNFINGKYVLIELLFTTSQPVTNKNMSSAIRQLISLE